MMTFEEFLRKKKIDRQQFGLAEPALLAEFAFDYAQMGEKSFDHTKKYWFNQLRRKYKLANVGKVENVAEVTEAALAKDGTQENLVAESAQPVKEILEPGSQKPEPTKQPETAPSSKPAFKPRFVPKKTVEPLSATDAEKTDIKSASEETSQEQTSAKPAFKPRFVASKKPAEPASENDVEKTDVKSASEEISEKQPEAKPAFKPRFVPPAKPKE